MIEEPFAAGSSLIHRLDPRFRIVLVSAFSIVVAISNHIPALLSALAVSTVLAAIARLNLKEVLKRLLVVFWFLLLECCCR